MVDEKTFHATMVFAPREPIAWKCITATGFEIVTDIDKARWAERNCGARIIPLIPGEQWSTREKTDGTMTDTAPA
jgi:hypothetical protein